MIISNNRFISKNQIVLPVHIILLIDYWQSIIRYKNFRLSNFFLLISWPIWTCQVLIYVYIYSKKLLSYSLFIKQFLNKISN